MAYRRGDFDAHVCLYACACVCDGGGGEMVVGVSGCGLVKLCAHAIWFAGRAARHQQQEQLEKQEDGSGYARLWVTL